MTLLRLTATTLIALILTGCATSASYTPPMPNHDIEKYRLTVNQDFDTVWKDLIQYSATTFFAIDNYEKDSGLITLSFGASNPSEFITGGQWTFKNPNNGYNFSGDYVDFMSQGFNATLSGRMNIVVSKLESEKTEVKISARYVFSYPSRATQYSSSPGQSWSFETGNCGTINVSGGHKGLQPTRTICPTYKAESAIINALKQ